MNPEFTAQSILPSSEEVPNRPTQYYPVVFAPDTAEDGAAIKSIDIRYKLFKYQYSYVVLGVISNSPRVGGLAIRLP